MVWISVVMLVGDHWVSGLVVADGRRFQDILNDRTSDYLGLSDARIYLAADMADPAAVLSKAQVTKANIVLAMLHDDNHEAPRKRATSFIRKDRHEAYLTVPGLEVKGYMHLLQRTDPNTFLARLAKDGHSFFPVTQSTVSAVGPLAEASQAPVTFVNRVHVDLLFVSDTPSLV